MRRTQALVTLTLTLLLPAVSSAAEPLFRPGTRSMFASLMLGPGISMRDTDTQIKLAQTFGYHFSGQSDGEAIALEVQESFSKDFVFLEVLPRFVWDIALGKLPLYLSPGGGMGFNFIFPEQGDTIPGLTIQVTLELKLILDDRWLVCFRPVGVDIHPLHHDNSWHTGVRYDLMLGGGATF